MKEKKENLKLYLENSRTSTRTVEYKGWISMILGTVFLMECDEMLSSDNDEITRRILRVKNIALKIIPAHIGDISLELQIGFNDAVKELISVI